MRYRILEAATDRVARFRPLLEELAALPAAAAVVSSMSAASHRREAADGTKRRSSECASFLPLVRVVERGSGFWSAIASKGREQRQEYIDNAIRISGAAGS